MKRGARHDVSSVVAIFLLENRSASPRRSAETASHTLCRRLGGGWKRGFDCIEISIKDRGMSDADMTFEAYVERMIELHGDGLCMDVPEERQKMAKLLADLCILYHF